MAPLRPAEVVIFCRYWFEPTRQRTFPRAKGLPTKTFFLASVPHLSLDASLRWLHRGFQLPCGRTRDDKVFPIIFQQWMHSNFVYFHSSGAVWALFALSENTAAQTRLRAELLAVDTETPTMDELNALQYLDCVVRETLRLHAPVTQSGTQQPSISHFAFLLIPRTARVAMCDDVIPLSTPYVDVHGNVQQSFRFASLSLVSSEFLPGNKNIEGPACRDTYPSFESRHCDLGSGCHGVQVR